MILQLINQSSERIPRRYLGDCLKFIEKQLRRRKIGGEFYKKELIVVFMDEAPARELNAQFRGKDYATDVLSFDPIEPDSMGELVLCPQVLKKQAKEHGLSFRDEAAYLTLHGVLHLLGFEHENGGRDAEIMLGLQDEIFDQLLQSTSP